MSRVVKIGNLAVGGRHPVRLKGMLKTVSRNEKMLIKEAKQLKEEGVEALRVAFKEAHDKKVSIKLKKEVGLPLVADIHFNYKLALMAIDSGFDGIRLNPLNIPKKDEVIQIIKEAKQKKISIRIGVNSGGFKKTFSHSSSLAKEMVRVAKKYIKIFEDQGFFDIMLSLKASDVYTTQEANRIFSQEFDYPLHLGITATGPFLEGAVKSSLGIGMLLSQGIGDIIRVSLTASSRDEVRVGKAILQFLGLRRFFPEIISCPTCGRCEVDLTKIVNMFKKKIEKFGAKDLPAKIAIMGCVVNGPGEAQQADIGVAFGKRKGAFFRKGKVIGVTDRARVVNDLLEKAKNVV
jgi:(E)-4-hydroxy-3-methylbut-2-enyl-diphosphate synthase